VVVNLLIDVQSEVPIYLQIARNLEEEILMGVYPEEEQIPSTTELSVGLKINPATVLKGMNQLVQDGVIYKKRGLGMFVCSGAVEKLRSRRQNEFYEKYVIPLMSEGQRLGIAPGQIIAMIEKGCDKT
jgi:DNA-binding transcriptional regulator YhcF (GntR family)